MDITSLRARFGAGVRARRLELGYTQEKLSAQIDLTVRYLAGIERGERNLSMDRMDDFSGRLQSDPMTLLQVGKSILEEEHNN